MASLQKRGKNWYYRLTLADGRRVMRRACSDKRESERMAAAAEIEQARVRAGLVDPRDLDRARHAAAPLGDHLRDFEAYLIGKGDTAKHARLYADRARRLAALACGAALADIDPPRTARRPERDRAAAALDRALAAGRLDWLTIASVQAALATLRDSGRSLQTLNHHRAALRTFILWTRKDGRLRDDPLIGLSSFNADEDRRHDRRTLALDELRRLIDAAHHRGPAFREMTGEARALCYRLAVASGLRYSEIRSITPGSFDFGSAPMVTVLAGFAKNGRTETLPLPAELAADLAAFVAGLPPDAAVFPMPPNDGATMLRADLAAAGIPYRDGAGRVFDFHALRCMLATLADAAGVSPRVVQRMMRHSKLEMTDRYTKPRLADLERAAATLPDLRPAGDDRREAARATGTEGITTRRRPIAPDGCPPGGGPEGADALVDGTDGPTHRETFAPPLRLSGDGTGRFLTDTDVILGTEDPPSMAVSYQH